MLLLYTPMKEKLQPCVIIDNPHMSSLIGLTSIEWLAGVKLKAKYAYILDLIRGGRCGVYLTRGSISKSRIGIFLEFCFWAIIHRVPIWKLKFFFRSQSISTDDRFFFFAHTRIDGSATMAGLRELSYIPAKKIAHLSHFMFYPEDIAKNAVICGISTFLSEVDLQKHSAFFRDTFKNCSIPVRVVPMPVRDDFRLKKEIKERAPRCLATGTFQYLDDRPRAFDALKKLGLNTFHPLRAEIYNRQEELQSEIVCRISQLEKDTQNTSTQIQPSSKKRDLFARAFLPVLPSRFHKTFQSIFFQHHGRRTYYDFDIVDLYNSYQMAIVGEEAVGLLAIGTLEAMRCGSVVFSSMPAVLEDYGFKEGRDFVGYDGSLNTLLQKIKEMRNNLSVLDAMSRSASETVGQYFTKHRIQDRFMDVVIDDLEPT